MNATEDPVKKAAEADEFQQVLDKLMEASAKAVELGIGSKPITGLLVRRAKAMGVDLERLGAEPEEFSDEEFYLDLVRVCWLMNARPSEVSEALNDGTAAKRAEEWAETRLVSIAHEAAALRMFVARWMEYRVALAREFADLDTGEPAEGTVDAAAAQ